MSHNSPGSYLQDVSPVGQDRESRGGEVQTELCGVEEGQVAGGCHRGDAHQVVGDDAVSPLGHWRGPAQAELPRGVDLCQHVEWGSAGHYRNGNRATLAGWLV